MLAFPNGFCWHSQVSRKLHAPWFTASLQLQRVTPLWWLRTHFWSILPIPASGNCQNCRTCGSYQSSCFLLLVPRCDQEMTLFLGRSCHRPNATQSGIAKQGISVTFPVVCARTCCLHTDCPPCCSCRHKTPSAVFRNVFHASVPHQKWAAIMSPQDFGQRE